ncbi:MAG: hypothetical protein IJY65_05455 [Clostridia bacterium]|nr:hypothetical protein [Clostridia bacterium]
MKFIFAKSSEIPNSEFIFSIKPKAQCDTLEICAADTYTVYIDGKFIAYGPERTAAGYSRKKIIPLKRCGKIEIKLLASYVTNYECDYQKPFFAASLLLDGKEIYTSEDFICEKDLSRIQSMPRYSGQRTFAEGFDLSQTGRVRVETEPVDSPIILEGVGEMCDYKRCGFTAIGKDIFKGFDDIRKLPERPHLFPGMPEFSPENTVARAIAEGWQALDFELEVEKTGFIVLDFNADSDCELFCAFEEIKPEGKWIFRRSGCNDFFYTKSPEGSFSVISREPYAMKFMKILVKGEVSVTPSLILYENDRAKSLPKIGNPLADTVLSAAKNTFMQNAVDIFTDCPGRERAGWLCDSYFTAKAERLFMGNNNIERAFLENIIIAKTPEVAPKMLPMCFPSQHPTGRYIPNWAMWFVLELRDYLERTGDRSLIDMAKEKVYGLVEFFDRYLNEDGLLENLDSWVFVEWSVANDYTDGVNFPSNMLYAKMLEDTATLYGDTALIARAEKMREKIFELSYNGEFFADHATRECIGLVRRDDHISETCQYYALFMGIKTDDSFKERMKLEFGPMRTDKYPKIGRSNMFIGNYLRFFWLSSIGEGERVLSESLEYFSKMAEKTGTLWEHDRPTASCNHGFASVAALLILDAMK